MLPSHAPCSPSNCPPTVFPGTLFFHSFPAIHISKFIYFSFHELLSSKTAIAKSKNKFPYYLISPLQFISPITHSKHFSNAFNFSIEYHANKISFCKYGKHCQKVCTIDKPRKGRIYNSGKEKEIKKYNWAFENIKLQIWKIGNYKYLGVTLNKDKNNKRVLLERIKCGNKTYFVIQQFFWK